MEALGGGGREGPARQNGLILYPPPCYAPPTLRAFTCRRCTIRATLFIKKNVVFPFHYHCFQSISSCLIFPCMDKEGFSVFLSS